MRYLIVLSLFLSSCAMKKLDLTDSSTRYSQVSDIMDATPRFGFIAYDHKYDFGIVAHTQDEKNYCKYLVGFEDNKMKYYFPESKITELREIFESKVGIEEKSKAILAKVQKLHAANYTCTNDYLKHKAIKTGREISEDVLNFIVYSPAIIITAPFWIPMMVAEGYKQNKNNMSVNAVFKAGLLGKKSKVVYDTMFFKHMENHDMEKFKVSQIYNTKDNMILIFENDILVGYLSGPQASRENLKK